MLDRLEDGEHPHIRIMQTTDDGRPVAYGTFYIRDLGTIPEVGDHFADLNNVDDYSSKVVYQRLFVREIFARSYWLLLTRPAEPSELTTGIVETTLLMTDYYEASKVANPNPTLIERLKQLMGWPTKAKRIKPIFRDPDPDRD
jgi:hypothetical protein